MGWILRILNYLSIVNCIHASGMLFYKIYFFLTAYVPRRLPENVDQINKMKDRLVKFYGVKDTPESWATVLAHICASPGNVTRKSYASIAAPAKRLIINGAVHEQKLVYYDIILKKNTKVVDQPQVVDESKS